jgi:8-oxo-dGTP pyrophosphatase MutT (NUDIX family)
MKNSGKKSMKWKTLSSREIFAHPRIILVEDEVELPDGGQTKYLKFKDNGNSVATILCKRGKKFLITKDYSYPQDKKIFMFPGGIVKAAEKIKDGANRELMEEVGLKAKKLFLMGRIYGIVRRSTMIDYFFYADDFSEEFMDSDPEEDVTEHWFTEKEMDKLMLSKEIFEARVPAVWGLYKLIKGKLK